MWAYFDSSALAKRYVAEAGRSDVMHLLRRYEVVTSAVVGIELRSALRRRVAEGTLEAEQVLEIHSRFTHDREFWALIDVSRNVLSAAETLVGTHRVRALDAIHVASAQLFAGRIGETGLVFVSADARQATVAAAVGLTARQIGP